MFTRAYYVQTRLFILKDTDPNPSKQKETEKIALLNYKCILCFVNYSSLRQNLFDNNIVVHIPFCHHFIILSKTRSDSGSGSMILYESGSRKIIGAPAESRSTSQLLFCIIAKNWRESLFGFISNTLSCVLSLSVWCVTVPREICPPPTPLHPARAFSPLSYSFWRLHCKATPTITMECYSPFSI